jgi:NitT/TauT family transport system permease protein
MLRVLRPMAEYGVALLLLIAAWWYASGPMEMPRYLLPSPQATLATLWSMLLSGELLPHLWFTLRNILLGLAIGAGTGIVGAYALYKLPRLATLLDGPLVVFQTAPKIALAPLFVVWFGLGLTAKLVLIFSLVFFPVLVGALAGFRGIDSRMHDIAKLLKLNPFQRFWRIDMMAALPGIFVGLKIGAVQALVGAVLAEWISGSDGLGYLMTYAGATYKTPLLFGAVLLTSTLGIVLHAALTILESRLLAWKVQDGR